jgi:hypothetical protein
MKPTDKLISELSVAHSKVTRDYSPIMRSVLSLYALSGMLFIALYFVRPFHYTIRNTGHGFELFFLFLFLNSVTFFGYKSFIPGERKKTSAKFVAISATLLLLSLIPRLFAPQNFNITRPNCELEAMAISMVTTLLGHLVLRKNEYALRSITSKVIFLSMPMIATVFLHGVCSLKWAHVIICHTMMPLLVPTLYLIITNRKMV